MLDALGFVAGHRIQRDRVNATEDAVFDVGVIAHQAAQQDLDLLPFGATAAIVADGAGLGKAAGALNKFQVVVAPPGDDIILADAVQRADECHAREVGAVQFGRHGLHL